MAGPALSPAEIQSLRDRARALFMAGVEAADPRLGVERVLRAREGRLEILPEPDAEGSAGRSEPWRRVHLVAFGKAACAMAGAARATIPEEILGGEGIAVTNYENLAELPGVRVIGAGHPLPDEAGLRGARAIAARVEEASADDLVLVLISGGGSALVPCPPDSIPLEDKIATTRLLLGCGADINRINCVRKHLSVLKGGGLARLATPAALHALILSDVLGDDLSAIASGPTVPDPTTYAEAVRVLEDGGVWDRVPTAVRAHLDKGCAGAVPETPKPGDPLFARVGNTLTGGNRLSLEAVRTAAEAAGRSVEVYSTALCGEAREAAGKLVAAAAVRLRNGRSTVLVAGGETTVTLHGSGRGGRNQELALAFALEAERSGLPPRWVCLSGGTDGLDGPTDAAGGLVDPGTLGRVRGAGGDPAALLESNDSHRALGLAGDLLRTGPTGTNVADLQVLLLA
jgi:hydroxypyruvate reductase